MCSFELTMCQSLLALHYTAISKHHDSYNFGNMLSVGKLRPRVFQSALENQPASTSGVGKQSKQKDTLSCSTRDLFGHESICPGRQCGYRVRAAVYVAFWPFGASPCFVLATHSRLSVEPSRGDDPGNHRQDDGNGTRAIQGQL